MKFTRMPSGNYINLDKIAGFEIQNSNVDIAGLVYWRVVAVGGGDNIAITKWEGPTCPENEDCLKEVNEFLRDFMKEHGLA